MYFSAYYYKLLFNMLNWLAGLTCVDYIFKQQFSDTVRGARSAEWHTMFNRLFRT